MKKESKTDLKNGKDSELSIEESFMKLDEILEKLESGDTSLEASFELYEQGIGLVRHAGESIDRVEKKLKILNGEADDDAAADEGGQQD